MGCPPSCALCTMWSKLYGRRLAPLFMLLFSHESDLMSSWTCLGLHPRGKPGCVHTHHPIWGEEYMKIHLIIPSPQVKVISAALYADKAFTIPTLASSVASTCAVQPGHLQRCHASSTPVFLIHNVNILALSCPDGLRPVAPCLMLLKTQLQSRKRNAFSNEWGSWRPRLP